MLGFGKKCTGSTAQSAACALAFVPFSTKKWAALGCWCCLVMFVLELVVRRGLVVAPLREGVDTIIKALLF